MFDEQKQKLIITSAKERSVQANLMKNLISSKDDADNDSIGTRDGLVESTVWDDKNYQANRNELSSNQKILYVGNSSRYKFEVEALLPYCRFDKFGIKFFINGNSALILVDSKRDTPEEYEEFYNYCVETERKVSEKIELNFTSPSVKLKSIFSDKMKGSKLKMGIATATAAVALPKTMIFAAGIGGAAVAKNEIKQMLQKGKVIDQKYAVGAQLFYYDFLQNFMDS